MKKRILALLGAVAIIVAGFSAVMIFGTSVMILFSEDEGLGLYMLGGTPAMMMVWFYFNKKYADPLIRRAISPNSLC